MKTTLDIVREKILDRTALERMLAIWRFREHRIVFTNGCFDIIHRGHLEYLSKAALLGDLLLIGLNTDASVGRLKGPSRPLQDQETRALVLAMMHVVSAVVYFDEDTPLELIKLVRPDVLVKGGDYREEEVVGAGFVRSAGGKVKIIPYITGHSTTEIIRRISS